MKINKNILAYVAGLMDGEGSIVIGVSKPSKAKGIKSPSHWLQVGITNTNKELIDWLHNLFGGHISDNSHAPSRRSQRPCWAWRVMSNKGCEFLKQIVPFLRIKKRQAELAIAFEENRRGFTNKATTQAQIEKREWYKQEIAKLTMGNRTPLKK